MKTLLVALAIALLFGTGCDDADVFGCNSDPVTCEVNSDCIQGNIPGACLPSPVATSTAKWCAFPDITCDGGFRWGILSGDGVASLCLAGEFDGGPVDDADPDAADAAVGEIDATVLDAAPPDALVCMLDPITTAGAANQCQQLDYPGAPGCHICVVQFISDGHQESHAGACCQFQKCLDTFGPWPWGPCD